MSSAQQRLSSQAGGSAHKRRPTEFRGKPAALLPLILSHLLAFSSPLPPLKCPTVSPRSSVARRRPSLSSSPAQLVSRHNCFILNSSTRAHCEPRTGLVGASVVQLIYKDPKYNVTALVRSEEKAAKLEKLGVNTVVGSLDNAELMTALASQSDVVIQIVR